MRISDWSSDVCSSDLTACAPGGRPTRRGATICARSGWSMPPIAAPPPAARSMSTRADALCGTAAAEPQPLRFSTGPLAFELVGGNVHAVRFGGVEILRASPYLLRDGDWGTLRPALAALESPAGRGGGEGGVNTV